MEDGGRTYNVIISIIKGLAIIGVVVGHCGMSSWLEAFVNQWHLATFFFVAGMCFKDKYASQPVSYIKRRVKSLYAPFVEFGLLFLVLHNVLYLVHCSGNAYTLREMGKELFNLTIRLTSNEPLMGAMWFCPVLLFTSIIMVLTRLAVCKLLNISGICKWGVFIPFLVFLVGYSAIQLHVKSPYCIWQNMVLSLVMWMGYWFRRYAKADGWDTAVHIAVAATGFILIALATSNGFMARLQPHSVNHEGAMALLLIPAMAGLSVHSLSVVLNKTCFKQALANIGNHSFSIMALHFLAFKAVNFAQVTCYGYNIERMTDFPGIGYGGLWGWGMAYVVAGIAIPLMSAHVYNTIKR